jgi:hypothetical protein
MPATLTTRRRRRLRRPTPRDRTTATRFVQRCREIWPGAQVVSRSPFTEILRQYVAAQQQFADASADNAPADAGTT